MATIYQPSLNPAIDNNGNIAPGAKMFFYLSQTKTPALIYSDPSGTVLLTNPVQADLFGRFPPVFLGNKTVYRVVLSNKTGSEVYYAVDDVRSDDYSASAFVRGYVRARRANVLDIADWDPTGTHDMASSYQTLINQAAAEGVPVDMPAGVALLGSTVAIPDGHTFVGTSGGSFNLSLDRNSCFKIAHTGKGFTRSGSGGSPITISNQVTIRNQPAVVSGSPWTPNDHDFDYYFEDISDLRMSHILTYNATRGIYFNGGRNNIKDWSGQCFKTGLKIDWSYDTCSIEDVHLWPFWNQSNEVRAYQYNNTRGFELGRVDNPFFSKIFAIWFRYGIYIGKYAGGGPSKPAGTVSKLKLTQADLDIGDIAYYVAPNADGHTAKFASVTSQSRDSGSTQPNMLIEGPNTKIVGDFNGDGAGSNVIRLSSTSAGSRISLVVGSNQWNTTGSGFPAVESVTGGGHVDILPGSFLTGGGGAAISSGDVTVITDPGGVPNPSFNQSSSYSAGTLGAKAKETISVKDAPFNALGDNSADDTAAITAAISAAIARKAPLYFPKGTYKVTSQIVVDLASVASVGFKMYGDGPKLSVINFGALATSPNFLLTSTGSPGDCFYPQIIDIGFTGNLSGYVVQFGKNDFSDPINKPVFKFAAQNFNTTSASKAVLLNHVLNADINIEANCGTGGTSGGNGVALTCRQLIMSRVTGATATADTGISFEDGYSYGNSFQCMDIENVGTCVRQSSPHSDKNTFLNGNFVYSSRGVESSNGGRIVFDNIAVNPNSPATVQGFTNPAAKVGVVMRDVVGYPVAAKGAASFSNATSVTVTHGLASAPSASTVQITPLGDVGSGIRYWLSGVSSTTFTVSTSGPATFTFAWQASVAGTA